MTRSGEGIRMLERSNRRLRRLVLVTAAAAVLPWLVAARGPAERIEAREIVLRGDDGAPRARLHVAREGSSLNFYDRQGKLRIALGITEYGPRWVSEAVDRAVRRAGDAGTPFALEGLAPGPGVADRVEGDDGPVLRFFDPRGRPRLEARVDMDRPVIFLHSDQGTLQVLRP